MPAESGDYTFRVKQLSFDSPDFWHPGQLSQTELKFTSAKPKDEDEVVALPAFLPTYDAPVDEHNQAPAEASFPLTVDFVGQDGYDPGQVGDVTVEVSYDEVDIERDVKDYTWTGVEVHREGDQWVAEIDNAAAAGKHVSVHVTGTAADGSTVDQYAMHVYRVE